MENEADRYSLHEMRKRSIPTDHFANFMTRVEAYYLEGIEARKKAGTGKKPRGGKAGDEEKSVLDYLSSHPATSRRIGAFRTGARVSGTPNPVFKTQEEWLDIQESGSPEEKPR